MKIFWAKSKPSDDQLDQLEAVAIDPRFIGSEYEIKLAEYLAKKAMGAGKNIAKQFRYEFLLWLSGKTDIRSAFAATSPKGKQEVGALIISFGKGRRQSAKALADRMKVYKFPKRKPDPLALEMISLSRIKN